MRTDELSTVSGNVFVVSDSLGNIIQGEAQGLFAADTRYLSQYELHIDNADIVLLRSGSADRRGTEVYAINTGRRGLPPHSLEVHRKRDLSDGFRERIELTNRGDESFVLRVRLVCDTDFADIFEVRTPQTVEASRRQVVWDDCDLVLQDRRRPDSRQARIRFEPRPEHGRRGSVRYRVPLDPGETWAFSVDVHWVAPEPETTFPVPVVHPPYEDEPVSDWQANVPLLETDDPYLELAYQQAIEDLATLEIALDSGHQVPAAGLPWYLAIFGRDSIIASLQCLLTGRHQAYGTLRTLAAYQSREDDPFRDAEPGKIAHEIRFGELAVTNVIPHARYYGTVDATPLWIMLLDDTISWSGRLELARDLLPVLEAALGWIDLYGDLNGDGFVEYQRRSKSGLLNQGWKDSWDGVRFADGRLAEGPIALIEVQGYCYAARDAAARIFQLLGDQSRADEQRARAESLRQRIHDAFWMPDEGYYALALDGSGNQVDAISSNPGHLLWCGAVDEVYASKVAERLMSPELYTGWGIRTLASPMKAFNPFSYHNGSVWPHDNSLILAGLARYGFRNEAMRVINGLLDASSCFERNRLPELFCGYSREQTPFPVDYPVACSPQAWASASVILMLQTMAGIYPREGELVTDPLPHGREIRLSGVRCRGSMHEIRADGPAEAVRAKPGAVGSPAPGERSE